MQNKNKLQEELDNACQKLKEEVHENYKGNRQDNDKILDRFTEALRQIDEKYRENKKV